MLTLLAVAGAFAIFQFGQQVLIRQATPRGEFRPPPPRSGPDYTKIQTWIARPEITDDPSEWLPEGAPPGESRPASIFYIHPTTYLERDRWNAPLSGNPVSDSRARLFVQSQASALTSAGRVWAPRYRQAAYGAFLLKTEDAQRALDVAFSDVESAFREFLSGMPSSQPIILAAHSQGALHLTRLLERHGAELKDRIVAAYVVGWPVSVAADLPAMGLPPCTQADQAGCVLSWQSFAEPANPDMILDAWKGTKGPTGIERERKDMLCVNPLTGTKDGAAPPQANPGTLVPNGDFTEASLVAGSVGARCEDGFLILNGEIPPLGPYVLPGQNYHVYDYALFWAAIRQDAERRLQAWQAR